MLPTLSQVCTLHSSFDQDLEDYAAAKCAAVEIWFTKLETYLQQHSLDDARRLRDEWELQFPAASYQGGLFTTQAEPRAAAWDLFRQRIELCVALHIPTMVVAADIPAPLSQEILDRLSTTLQEIAVAAGSRGIRIALEFQCRSAFCNNLETAVAMIEEVASPHLGICLDAFHFFTGPSKMEDLAYLTPDNLFHVQLSDISGSPRELASDSDRILPGDGDFPLSSLLEGLRAIGYAGAVSLELLNPQIWQIPSLSLGEIGLTALRKQMGIAETR